MARYDRIAPLVAPARASAFPGWPVLRDVEGNDRDVELARRARLRFLALRPVRRLLDRGDAGVGRDSYLAQIEAVREELGYLPTRDVERARLARFLHQIEDRDPARVIGATIEMAEAAVAAGQLYGAEEYGLTALGLAQARHELRLQSCAYATLARVERMRENWDEARAAATSAAEAAEAAGDFACYVRAEAEHAFAAATRGEANAARAFLNNALKRVRASHDAQAEALAEAKLCACEIALGNASVALEHGWAGLRSLEDLHERALLLEQVGGAFATLGLHKAAERCFAMVAQRGVDPSLRARARAGQAVEAAAAGSAQMFRDRKTALLNDAAEWSADPRVYAFVHLEIGRGGVIVGDVEDAREHLRAAITTASRHGFKDILNNAEDVLGAFEKNATRHLITASGNGPAADAARRIAEQLEALPDLRVTAG